MSTPELFAARDPARRALPLRLQRAPFALLALAALVAGIWGGLLRLSWALPAPQANWITYHGHLMVSGFLGTLIGLERAAGLGLLPAYLVPFLSGAGALCVAAGILGPVPPALVTVASAGLLAEALWIARRQPPLVGLCASLGALGWLGGSLLWLAGREPSDSVLPWVSFLVLTVAGERLELARFLRPSRRRQAVLLAACLLLAAGTALGFPWPGGGARIAGAGLAALALWLLRHDIARRNVREGGLHRFMGLSLLGGYLWLALGGAIAMVAGAPGPGPVQGALVHAVFLGFVFSMIFAHAPVILPAVMRVEIPFRRLFYAHLLLLHLSLAVRVLGALGGWCAARLGGDAAPWVAARSWGGLLNAAAIALFLAATAGSALFRAVGRRRQAAARPVSRE